MRAAFEIRELVKLYPLMISRGLMTSSDNLFVTVTDGTHTGIGELSPATGSAWTAERGQAQLEAFTAGGIATNPHDNYAAMREANIDPPAMAALDTALWDLLAKQAGMPLYRLLGLPKRGVPTSVTIGINPPEVTRERVPEILRSTGAKCLKIKLGSPQGREHDKAHFLAAAEAAAPFQAKLRVDANGGWTVAEAIAMIQWLAEQGVDYVEQPLAEGQEAGLPEVFASRPIPIFVDESIRFSEDVPKIADRADGVNLKLMKCGGITEAVRIVAAARAHGLKTMIGCMSESSVAIAAGAAIGALFDYIDLDSHLNLNPDPAGGASIVDGVIVPSDAPGHGAFLNA
ncbi:dipeptide epimerase [Fimbriimonas ginsengisoli]|uniref:Dipeptide epimerase n=1 Tax=Fimbriimonas ginsengisoli Gsoil 348 TaxID=661478 RepID=A0A068NP52_FIMGI|nr:dipeptide epimerase [Fimbriimonas ginsengisoli]AIE85221.1 Mandelate racemase/muconate lactonizing enzyme [Fimbriimonas ginsengisoli Gsoil 348]